MMKAVQYTQIGQPPQVVDIPTPEPGPGEIRLRITAAGLCHSDWAVMGMSAEQLPFDLPLTLGHEGVGVIDALGGDVPGVEVGQSVAVYGPWGCGVCHACATGAENYCPRAGALGIRPPGLGAPGAMAEYMIVDDKRHLVPLGDLDPVQAVSLTDAGLTPYHAVTHVLGQLRPGATALVLGVGGLGHVGVQLIRALSSARIIAADTSEQALALASDLGADAVLTSDARTAEEVRRLTDGLGADVVFDFVGVPATAQTAQAAVAVGGRIEVVGIGGGAVGVGFGSTPWGVSVRSPFWGTRPELAEVIELFRTGAISVHTERYSIDEAPAAYARLHDGKVVGRAVVVP